MIKAYSSPQTAWAESTAPATPQAVLGCAEELFKTVLTCGSMLALAPETLGASVVAAVPCAIQAMGFGKCLADKLAEEDAASVRQALERACLDRGGVPLDTGTEVSCFVLREP